MLESFSCTKLNRLETEHKLYLGEVIFRVSELFLRKPRKTNVNQAFYTCIF